MIGTGWAPSTPVIIPIFEDVIAEIGEDAALDAASRIAERSLPGATFDGSSPQRFPAYSEETGAGLPPIRAYRFRRDD